MKFLEIVRTSLWSGLPVLIGAFVVLSFALLGSWIHRVALGYRIGSRVTETTIRAIPAGRIRVYLVGHLDLTGGRPELSMVSVYGSRGRSLEGTPPREFTFDILNAEGANYEAALGNLRDAIDRNSTMYGWTILYMDSWTKQRLSVEESVIVEAQSA